MTNPKFHQICTTWKILPISINPLRTNDDIVVILFLDQVTNDEYFVTFFPPLPFAILQLLHLCAAIAIRSSYHFMSNILDYIKMPHDSRYTLYSGCQTVRNAKMTPKSHENGLVKNIWCVNMPHNLWVFLIVGPHWMPILRNRTVWVRRTPFFTMEKNDFKKGTIFSKNPSSSSASQYFTLSSSMG